MQIKRQLNPRLPLFPTPCAPITAIFTSDKDDFFRRMPRVVIVLQFFAFSLSIQYSYVYCFCYFCTDCSHRTAPHQMAIYWISTICFFFTINEILSFRIFWKLFFDFICHFVQKMQTTSVRNVKSLLDLRIGWQ